MITGIVAEYNPFHSGHQYQTEKLRENGADGIIAVMSGNFVQRCEPAFFRKHARAEAAVRGGIDLVIELPVRFATASAEKFAFGAVYLLDMCGCDVLNFGSECGDIEQLEACAEKLIEADENGLIAKAVSGEESFARTRQRIGGEILSEPNNTLGVEYIKALKKLNSNIRPTTIKRTFGYHASASELRRNIPDGNFEGLPETTKEIILREKALGKLLKCPPPRVTGCGRTDTGVHAKMYVCNFYAENTIPYEKFPMALNTKLPDDIICLSASEADDDFDSRYMAKKKTYSYYIKNSNIPDAFTKRYAWHYKYNLDLDKMKEAAKAFLGTHDFLGFAASGFTVKTTVRTIYSLEIEKKDDLISIDITGDGFLYNMVRIIAGTLVFVGSGKIKVEDMPGILESKDRKRAGITAPAHGLFLSEVYYD